MFLPAHARPELPQLLLSCSSLILVLSFLLFRIPPVGLAGVWVPHTFFLVRIILCLFLFLSLADGTGQPSHPRLGSHQILQSCQQSFPFLFNSPSSHSIELCARCHPQDPRHRNRIYLQTKAMSTINTHHCITARGLLRLAEGELGQRKRY